MSWLYVRLQLVCNSAILQEVLNNNNNIYVYIPAQQPKGHIIQPFAILPFYERYLIYIYTPAQQPKGHIIQPNNHIIQGRICRKEVVFLSFCVVASTCENRQQRRQC